MDYVKRAEIWKAHVNYTKGLLFFVGNEPRVPEHIRNEIAQWGYPKKEYIINGTWSHQLYMREARRMKGELVMTQHQCKGRGTVKDGVGMAAYTMDSHNCDRVVVKSEVTNDLFLKCFLFRFESMYALRLTFLAFSSLASACMSALL